jgi:hypothetical protein
MNTNNVPVYGSDGSTNPSRPVQMAQGSKVPLRVLVRNLGDPEEFIVLSYDAAVLTNPGNPGQPPSGNTYELPGGQSDAFIVMPGEILYGIAVSGRDTVRASWAVSEALPHDFPP